MSVGSDHARTLFAAVVPDRRDLLEDVLSQLGTEHFLYLSDDDRWKNMFIMFNWYYQYAGGVLTKKAIVDVAAMKLPGKEQLYESTYESLEHQKVSESEFRWALYQLKELYATDNTKRTFLEGMQILTGGIESSKGEEIKGHIAAREHVMARLGEIDQRLTVQEAPDGDVREEESDILEEYEKKKATFLSGGFSGIEFGVPRLDHIVGGLQPGELDFILGYTSAGKSSLCCQLAWQACVRQGKNVVYATSETLRPQIRRKVISRHSRMKQFGIEEGLNSLDLKRGTLSAEQEEKMREVVYDFTHCEDYGKLRVLQTSEAMTVTGLKVRLQAIQREFPIDLVIIDALYLLKAETRRQKERDELNEKIEQAMILAKTFDNGNGLPIISPWQASRQAKEDALKEGRYSMAAMAETAYAERYADIIISLLEPLQPGRYVTLSCAALKQRDGEQSPGFDIDADYATSYFTDSGTVQRASHEALIGLGLDL